MRFLPFANQTIIIHRAPLVMDAGNAMIQDWDNAAQIVVKKVHVQPASKPARMGQLLLESENQTALRDISVSSIRLIAPPDLDLRVDDRVAWQGDLWEVDGHPSVFPGPFGVDDHLEVSLRRVEG